MTPGRVTLASAITQVRQRSDLENNDFVSDAELTSWLSSSTEELYDLLVSSYGDEYSLSSSTFVTTEAQGYDLPADIYKLDSLEVTDNTGHKRSLKRLPWAERDDDQRRAPARSYAVRGDQVWLFPPPAAGQTVTLWYVPRPAPLAASGTIQLLPEFAQGDTLTIDGVQFASQLWETFGTAVQVIFSSVSSATVQAGYSYTDRNGTEWLTAADFATSPVAAWEADHAYMVWDTVHCDNAILRCEQSTAPTGSSVTATSLGELIIDGGVHWRVIGLGTGVTRVYTATMYAVEHDMCLTGRISSAGDSKVPQGVASVFNLVNASYYAPPTVHGTAFGFWYGRLDLTARHLADRISKAGVDPASPLYGLAASVGTGAALTTITITSARPYRCELSGLSATVYAPSERWANYLDGISGWEEYAVTDCTIKAKLKDEQDVSPEMAQKEALRQRIIRMSKHRDRGPQRPSDTWGLRGGRPWPWTGGGLR